MEFHHTTIRDNENDAAFDGEQKDFAVHHLQVSVIRHNENAVIPEQAHVGDVGFDLSTIDSGWILPFQRKKFRTGLTIIPTDGYELQIRPRSGMALNRGLTVLNAPATIEPTYRGDIGIILYNTSLLPRKIEVGDRIAQGVFKQYVERIEFELSKTFTDTIRGASGFGQSGK